MKTEYKAIVIAAVLAATGCGTFRGVSDLKSATGYFIELLRANQIPGVSSGNRGKFFTVFDPPGFTSGYPMTVNASLTPTGQKEARVYVMRKETPSSPWLITQAWTRDENGNRVDLPIPTREDQLKANEELTEQHLGQVSSESAPSAPSDEPSR